jgi:hypothetical protein
MWGALIVAVHKLLRLRQRLHSKLRPSTEKTSGLKQSLLRER